MYKIQKAEPCCIRQHLPQYLPTPRPPRKEGTRSGDDAESLTLGLQPRAVLPSSVPCFLVHHHSEDGRKGDRSRFAWGVRQSPRSYRAGHSRKSTCLPAPISDCTEAHILQTTVKAYTWSGHRLTCAQGSDVTGILAPVIKPAWACTGPVSQGRGQSEGPASPPPAQRGLTLR